MQLLVHLNMDGGISLLPICLRTWLSRRDYRRFCTSERQREQLASTRDDPMRAIRRLYPYELLPTFPGLGTRPVKHGGFCAFPRVRAAAFGR